MAVVLLLAKALGVIVLVAGLIFLYVMVKSPSTTGGAAQQGSATSQPTRKTKRPASHTTLDWVIGIIIVILAIAVGWSIIGRQNPRAPRVPTQAEKDAAEVMYKPGVGTRPLMAPTDGTCGKFEVPATAKRYEYRVWGKVTVWVYNTRTGETRSYEDEPLFTPRVPEARLIMPEDRFLCFQSKEILPVAVYFELHW